ncbi:uncharacterized protein LOC114318223 [Camellia sinensis]|uniref:uncharacterized protein LOC114318223 n=1 Tax=Camellia sinensis TaxID=4442 RepID=UPI001035FAE5|nr:uncharacterized protein LOC114318223 [Camellia sinensis]
MKELGDISYFLGISIEASGSAYILSNKKYAQEILNKVGMLDCKSCSSPISVKLGLPPNSDVLFDNPSFYRSIVGVLQYLTITRPDLSYAVNQLCQHMHIPTIGHFAGVKRLLRFVKGTITHGLTYTPSLFDLQAYSDSNWARDSVDKKSTSVKKEATMSKSSTEAEYRSLAHITVELAWIVFYSKSKHIEVDCHYVQDQVFAKKLVLHSIPTIDQLVNIFTKPLFVSRFSYLKDKLMAVPPSISLRGNVENHSLDRLRLQPKMQIKPNSTELQTIPIHST